MAKYETYNSKGMKKLSKPSEKPSPKPRGRVYDGGGYKTYDSNAMDKLAKERLLEKTDPGSPPPPNAEMKSRAAAKEFSPLERDLPKSGRAMKLAEPLGAAALPEAAAGVASGLARVGGMVGAGMLIPSEIGEEEKTIGGGIVPLPQDVKGRPKMQDMEQATQLKPSKDQKFIKRFEEEGRKHLDPEFKYQYDVGVEDRTVDPPESYRMKMKATEDDELSRLKAVANHNAMRKNPKMGKVKGGTQSIEKNNNRSWTLEEDED